MKPITQKKTVYDGFVTTTLVYHRKITTTASWVSANQPARWKACQIYSHTCPSGLRENVCKCDIHSKSRNKYNRKGVRWTFSSVSNSGLLLGLLVTFVEYIASTNAPSCFFCFSLLSDCLSQSRLKKYDLLQFALPLKREKFRLVALKRQQHLLSSCFSCSLAGRWPFNLFYSWSSHFLTVWETRIPGSSSPQDLPGFLLFPGR